MWCMENQTDATGVQAIKPPSHQFVHIFISFFSALPNELSSVHAVKKNNLPCLFLVGHDQDFASQVIYSR